jgi:aryl-alcohol dehydrogenase-like predicted oxidoreductase
MGFSHAYGAATEKNAAIRAIEAAFDMGYTLFDTAEVYGSQDDPHDNEQLVGAALKNKRADVQIISKFGIHFDLADGRVNHALVPDSSEAAILKSVDGSLKRLGTDYIDLYFQHRIDPKTEPEDVAAVMAKLIKAGKIRHWGISEANEEYLRRAHKVCPVTAIENRYSLMARHYEALFPVLEELNIGMVAFSPLANGVLSGKYRGNDEFDKKLDYRSVMPQFTKAADAENRELFALLKRMGEAKGATAAQVSLAWMLCKKPYIVPIPGSRKLERMKENLGAADVILSKAEVAEIDNELRHMKMSAVFGGTPVKKE